jgi:hypothetical protein
MRFRIYHLALTVCLVFAVACAFERPAYGYVDPGSGILACQAISAMFAGVIYYFRRRVMSVMRLFRGPRGSAEISPQAGGTDS